MSKLTLVESLDSEKEQPFSEETIEERIRMAMIDRESDFFDGKLPEETCLLIKEKLEAKHPGYHRVSYEELNHLIFNILSDLGCQQIADIFKRKYAFP